MTTRCEESLADKNDDALRASGSSTFADAFVGLLALVLVALAGLTAGCRSTKDAAPTADHKRGPPPAAKPNEDMQVDREVGNMAAEDQARVSGALRRVPAKKKQYRDEPIRRDRLR